MSLTVTPIDELGAINTMLVMIGEAPINSLTVTGLADVAVARKVLADTLREVQEQDWHFNRELKFQIVPDDGGYLNLPTNCLRVDSSYSDEWRNIVQRGSRLYDVDNQTYVFTEPVYVDMVIGLQFTELPQAARWYITVKSCRRFTASRSQSDLLYQFSERDEGEALVRLQQADVRNDDPNMLTGSLIPFSISNRRI